MTKIQKLADEMMEEVDGAKNYAECYIEWKAKGDTQWANRFKEMASDELRHGEYIHELAVNTIKQISSVYSAPTYMEEKWDKEHKKYVDKAAWVKQMLSM